MQQPEQERTKCRDCGGWFDAASTNYFDNICPPCMTEQDPERTWPSCWVCSDKVPPDERTSVKVRGAARDPTWVHMAAHEDCAEDHTPRRHGP